MPTLIHFRQEYLLFFYKPGEGLCLRIKKNHFWQEHIVLLRETDGIFNIFSDDEKIHAIVLNQQNELVYLQYNNNNWTKHKLCTLKPEICPTRLLLCESKGHINLFYSARYNDELLLIHCLLGNHAQPRIIDRLSCDAFVSFRTRIYYTNAQEQLVYQDFSDGKPEHFFPVANQAKMPYLLFYCGKSYLTYVENEKNIIFEGHKITESSDAKNPLLLTSDNRLTLLWQSHSFLYYTNSDDGGASWSKPLRYLHTASEIEIFEVISNRHRFYYYAAPIAGEIHFFANPSPFKESDFSEDSPTPSPPDFEKLRIHLELLQRDIKQLRAQIQGLQNTREALKTDE